MDVLLSTYIVYCFIFILYGRRFCFIVAYLYTACAMGQQAALYGRQVVSGRFCEKFGNILDPSSAIARTMQYKYWVII